MSGVEEHVENYQSYLAACCGVMEFESYEILFVFVLLFVSRSLMVFMLKCAFIHIFSLRILIFAVENV